MKTLLLVLGCLVVLASGYSFERSCSELKALLSRRLEAQDQHAETRLRAPALTVRSCDGDGDGALNSAEFSGCLQGLTGAMGARGALGLGVKRAACFQSFMREADEDADTVVSSVELGRWTAGMGSSARALSSNAMSSNVMSSNAKSSNEMSRGILDLLLTLQFNCIAFCTSDSNCGFGQKCLLRRCCNVNNVNNGGDNGDNGDNGNVDTDGGNGGGGDTEGDSDDNNGTDGGEEPDANGNTDGDADTKPDLVFGIDVNRSRRSD